MPADVSYRRFRGQSLLVRGYIAMRRLLISLDDVERWLPPSGRQLDAACGYGALAILMALRSPHRSVIGIDLDARRVGVARDAASGIANLEFRRGDITVLGAGSYAAIVMIDALHYFAREAQVSLLREFQAHLEPGGLLLLRHPLRTSRWQTRLTLWHERAMLALRVTKANEPGMDVAAPDEFQGMLRDSGLELERMYPAHRWLPYADHIIVGRRRA